MPSNDRNLAVNFYYSAKNADSVAQNKSNGIGVIFYNTSTFVTLSSDMRSMSLL